MASLSTQIANLTPTQRSAFQVKLKPIIAPLGQQIPFAGPIVDGVLKASAGGLAMAIKPLEPFLPSWAKTAIQGAILAVLGPAAPAPTTTSGSRFTFTRPTLSPGMTLTPMVSSGGSGGGGTASPAYTPVPFDPEPWYASKNAKIGLAIGGVFIGFAAFKKMKKKK